jgi:hypothetical protein
VAAVVSIRERNGPSGSPTDTPVTTIQFSTSDVVVPGTDNPLVRPQPGLTNYSFHKSLFLNADTSPAVRINNVKFFTDGAITWTGGTLRVGSRPSYTQATGTVGTTGVEAGGALGITMGNAQNYIAASPLSIPGQLLNPTTGRVSDFIILQVAVSDQAVPGYLGAETLSILYDEV